MSYSAGVRQLATRGKPRPDVGDGGCLHPLRTELISQVRPETTRIRHVIPSRKPGTLEREGAEENATIQTVRKKGEIGRGGWAIFSRVQLESNPR
jgi:hypothetical protein